MFWEFKIKEFLDGEIFVIFVVLRVFFMEMLVCFLLEDIIEVVNIDCVEIGVFIKYVVDLWFIEVINLLIKVLGGMVLLLVEVFVGLEVIVIFLLLLKV